MKNPIQPIVKDKLGVLRFKPNAIVEHLLKVARDAGVCDMNKLAFLDFSADDRQQFAQLVGYSLSGYSELGYVDSDAYDAAYKMAMTGATEEAARIAALTEELEAIREGLREPVARLFGKHPDDLRHEP